MRPRIAGSISVAAILVIAGCGSSPHSSTSRHKASSPGGGSAAAELYISEQSKTAEKQIKLDPSNQQAWANLVEARYDNAAEHLDPATGSYSATGKTDLAATARAWQRYLKLAKHPEPTLAEIMGQAYQDLGDYSQAADAWRIAAAAHPGVASYWEHVAVAAYIAKDTDLGDLAATKAIRFTPRAQRAAIKQQLDLMRTQAGAGG
jgi:tetratricopeptide (TPR) repeat protein